jgi:acyl-CoA thioesterase FadM
MKNIFFLLLTSLYSFIFSQSENDIILIRTKVEKINTDSKNYQTAILKSDQGLSTEGNEITVYTEQLNEIKLIKEIYYGRNG